ncbi:MAG: nucleoside triphosphate pyrophosphohydrolase [Dehalococcoidia bacterium]|nr:nucleoside triphosphate pyrophosphohydrolase [Dehalococcoidia bacterium]
MARSESDTPLSRTNDLAGPALGEFQTLERIVARLRAPDGCPWDKAQTHSSIKRYLLEEAYEAIQALDDGDPAKLREELGDLLLQIMLHTQIATETGEFQRKDLVAGLAAKLIRRHPHVFGGQPAADAEEVAHNWEEIKKQERADGASLLSSVPEQLPALARSQVIQRRVASAGFDWRDFTGILDKLSEEVAELKKADSKAQRLDEFGDLLFALVNAARWLDLDAEESLRQANRKFSSRFMHMEELCRKRGINFASLSFDQQNALWDEAKAALSGRESA